MRLKARYFFILAIGAFLLAVSQVAAHQRYAGDLVNTITTKDQSGLDTTGDRQVLKTYIGEHMGTSRSLALQASYDRAVSAAQAATNSGATGAVYAAAQSSCASHADSIRQAQCVQNYLATHTSTGSNPTPVSLPNRADYVFEYPSPAWTADSAGWAFAAALVLFIGGLYALILRPTIGRPSRRSSYL